MFMVFSIEEVREARGKVAELAAQNPLLQPVFDRLDREYKAMVNRPRISPVQLEAMRRADLRQLA